MSTKDLLQMMILCTFCFYTVIGQDVKNLTYQEIDSMTSLYYKKGDYSKAIPYLQTGREKAKKDFGTQDSIYAKYVGDLGSFYTALGQYKKAVDLYLEAKNINAKVLGIENVDYAESLGSLAGLYQKMGLYDLAQPLYLEAQKIYSKKIGLAEPEYANSLSDLALLYIKTGQYELSRSLFIEAKNIRAKVYGVEHQDYAISLNNLAGLYQEIGQYEQALPLMLEACKIRGNTLGKEHQLYANSVNNLAGLYDLMGKTEESIGLYIEAKNIRAKVLGKEHPEYAESLNNLAFSYIFLGQYAQAKILFLEANAIYLKVFGTAHPTYIHSLNNLAQLYQEMDDYPLAWETVRMAIQYASNVKNNNIIDRKWADSLSNANYPSNAHIQSTIQSLSSLYEILDMNSIDVAPRQAFVCDVAAALLKKLKDSHSSDEDKLRMLAQSNDWLLYNLRVLDLDKDAAKSFAIAEQNKSVLLLDASKAETAYEIGDLPDSLARQEKDFFKTKEELQAMLIEQRSESEKDSLQVLLNQVNQGIELFKNKIEKEYPKYANLKYKQIDAKVQDIQQLLDNKTAFIEYVIGYSFFYIFYVDKNNLKCLRIELERELLTTKIRDLHAALSNYKFLVQSPAGSYQQYTQTAHWLYQQLLAPVMSYAKDIEHLIIVTDGELGHLPFESFLVESAPKAQTDYTQLHYLINDFKISYNYSATLWKENKEAVKPSNNGQVLAMAANYDIQLDAAKSGVRLPAYQELRKALNPLAEARKEVEILQKNFQGYFGFDKMATEKIFKEKAGDYAIIHLAMHGLLDSKAPILSSLAFTEDGDSVENNFLQAYEISKLKLNADLVILSACETGYGKFEKGNGIASLARAFMYAGASSLIVSLWQVNDYATAEVMKNLYQNLADGMDKADALRQAKLVYIQKAQGVAAHPAFWSPFILMGDSSAITVEKKHAFSVPWIAAGILILILIIAFFARRKYLSNSSIQ